MSNESAATVQRLWNYCSILRDDGVSYGIEPALASLQRIPTEWEAVRETRKTKREKRQPRQLELFE